MQAHKTQITRSLFFERRDMPEAKFDVQNSRLISHNLIVTAGFFFNQTKVMKIPTPFTNLIFIHYLHC